MILANGTGLPGWLVLGERDGAEFSFGAVGKCWQPSIEWRDVPLAEFAGFDDPEWVKIACSFIVRPWGQHRSVLTYECRTTTYGTVARQKFARYWWLIKPFVGHIMRATLAKPAVDARARSRALFTNA